MYKLHEKYGPTPKAFEISERFALKLHDKITTLIRDFKAVRVKEYQPSLVVTVSDGENVTFRCVAGDELWSLMVHNPQGRALKLSNLFSQMVIDAEDGNYKLDEKKYSKLLDKVIR